MFTRNILQMIRSFSTAANISVKSHYDVLEIKSRATQAEVKDAYYKLSKLYHPDKNKGSANAIEKFRKITEAYEILGNVRTRRLYDKGISHINVEEPLNNFYRSREFRSRPPSAGKTPIYDFDEWSRMHYGATFARDMKRKRNLEFFREMELNRQLENKRLQPVLVITMTVLLMMSLFHSMKGYNHVQVSEIKQKPD